VVKASNVYFNGEFKTANIKVLDKDMYEVTVITYDGKRGKCVIHKKEDWSLEVIEDEEVK